MLQIAIRTFKTKIKLSTKLSIDPFSIQLASAKHQILVQNDSFEKYFGSTLALKMVSKSLPKFQQGDKL